MTTRKPDHDAARADTAPPASSPSPPPPPSIDALLAARLIEGDPWLSSYEAVIRRRLEKVRATLNRLTRDGAVSLADFASGHEYFGMHFRDGQWIFREWAPNATAMFLIGEMTGWTEDPAHALRRVGNDGVWEITLPERALRHGLLYRLRLHWPGGHGDRLPSHARRVVQDPCTLIFNAQIWRPDQPYVWRHSPLRDPDRRRVLVYEAHVGMAQAEPRVGTYREFTRDVLPRIAAAGYDTIQLMAIQEHPYYGSFGYQVSNFFAASSRFGTPEDLKELVDTAHGLGLAVVMDIVHSHAVSNEVEGLSRFDGTTYQYFHDGPRGRHIAWDSRCFDYGRHQVLHFLLSNCRFWLDEYRIDGFRFDGVTSMLYLDHGLEKAFTSYDDYFGANVDEDALAYLTLANQLIHELNPHAVTIAEDVSGLPGLAAPLSRGGTGFDFRFAMGVPDFWIKLTKDRRDEDWPMGGLWHELNNRRNEERTISYAESHDQALVGDKTLIFRMADADMYTHMSVGDGHLNIDRAMALHKMIRLVTLATAGAGYLTFMGNEFGHPEWIDFPRDGNNWSYHYARRQWHLADDPDLKYRFLGRFDRDMIALARRHRLLDDPYAYLFHEHDADKVLIFGRAGLILAFNFHPTKSYRDYRFAARPGRYVMTLDTDAAEYGGHARLQPGEEHESLPLTDDPGAPSALSLYLPARSALVLMPVSGAS